MVPLLTELLGLPGIDVESYEDLGDRLILSVEVHAEEASCPRCGTLSHRLHQNHGYLVRDLGISHYQTYFRSYFRPRQLLGVRSEDNIMRKTASGSAKGDSQNNHFPWA